jgi:hypothetical protein
MYAIGDRPKIALPANNRRPAPFAFPSSLHSRHPQSSPDFPTLISGEPGEPALDAQQHSGEPKVSPSRAQAVPNRARPGPARAGLTSAFQSEKAQKPPVISTFQLAPPQKRPPFQLFQSTRPKSPAISTFPRTKFHSRPRYLSSSCAISISSFLILPS